MTQASQPSPADCRAFYNAAATREIDRVAIEEHGIPGYQLMQRAATAAYQVTLARWPRARHIVVICGSGNNGGDGYVLARLLAADGRDCHVFAISPARSDDALRAYDDYIDTGGRVQPFEGRVFGDADLIVDAMLGTGIDRPLAGPIQGAADAINRAPAPVLALDIPTGLHSDKATPLGSAVCADATVTFIARKFGLYTGPGKDYAGRVYDAPLDVPAEVYAAARPLAYPIQASVPARRADTHKGSYGRVLVAGGAPGMGGAVALAGTAALCTGADLVRLATHPDHATRVAAHHLELMVEGVRDAAGLRAWTRRCDALVIGPGLGQRAWARHMVAAAGELDAPQVVDADALRFLHAGEAGGRRVLTPHPGEAAALLGTDVKTIQHDRYAAVRAIQREYGGVVVLKGAGTLIADEQRVWLCERGNPGLASAGTGDVLSGVIGGLLAQGLSPADAACTGVLRHALAGDRAAAERGEASMIASDLFAYL